MDYQINATNTMTVRYEPSLNTAHNQGIGNFTLPSQSFQSSMMEHSIQATETMLVGASMVNETRFQFRHQNAPQTPDSTDPSIIVSNAFNGGGASAGLHDFILTWQWREVSAIRRILFTSSARSPACPQSYFWSLSGLSKITYELGDAGAITQ